MLELVDAESNRFAEAHGAEVRGHFHAVLVRLIDCRGQLRAADLRVRLEPRHSLLRPVAHEPPRIVGSVQRMHRRERRSWPLQIRPCGDDLRSRRLQRVGEPLEVELLVRVHAPRSADRGHARRQEEPRIARAHVAHPAVVHVVVQTDDPGDHGLPREIDDVGALGDRDRAAGADGRYPLAAHDYRLIVARGGAGSVNHARVRECDHRRVHTYVLAHRLRKVALLGRRG